VLLPPLPGTTVEGRPLLNLSLAVNNLAGLTLFGIVRRTLLLPAFRERMGRASTGIATAAALLWLVHPLQTESVTCR
jgi:hypothetical protein